MAIPPSAPLLNISCNPKRLRPFLFHGLTPFVLIVSYSQECYPFFSVLLCHHLAIRTGKISSISHGDVQANIELTTIGGELMSIEMKCKRLVK